jgi:hypothetical protein
MSDDRIPEDRSENEAFLSRWSRRKQEANIPQEERTAHMAVPDQDQTQEQESRRPLSDADMPSIESLDEHSDYSGFLSPEVSEALRQQALQKLFRSAVFNVCDGLDDYAEDFTNFEKLGEVMTAELRHRLRQEAKRAAERAQTASQEQEEKIASEDQRRVELQERDPDANDSTSRLQGDLPAQHIETDEDEMAS